MYNAYTSGMGLQANVPTLDDRARGPHFGGAPAAAFNIGPASASGMSIFGSSPAGELMGAPSDDHLFSPAVAPVTRAYAVVSGVTKPHLWLPKGTVVQVSELTDADKAPRTTAIAKAERAGHNLKRLLCEHCTDASVAGYAALTAYGVVGVLAEAADVGTDAMKGQGGYVVVTLALENAAEVYIRPDLLEAHGETTYRGGWTNGMTKKAPAQTVTLQARNDLAKFRVATVLAQWTLGEEVGLQACLHPQQFTCSPAAAAAGGPRAFSASRRFTQAKMKQARI